MAQTATRGASPLYRDIAERTQGELYIEKHVYQQFYAAAGAAAGAARPQAGAYCG